MFRKLRKINHRHYICVGLTFVFIVLSFLLFRASLLRFWETLKDLGISIGYYFMETFKIPHGIQPTVTAMPGSTGFTSSTLPETHDGFFDKLNLLFGLIFTKTNFFDYLDRIAQLLNKFVRVLIFIIPFILLFVIIFKRILFAHNNRHGYKTLPLRVFLFVTKYTYIPVKNYIVEFWFFIKSNEVYKKLWLVTLLFSLNLMSVIFEFFAFYFYFVVSFDVINIYIQVKKLFVDLSVVFRVVPLWLWLIFGLTIFNKLCHKWALSVLVYYEMRNKSFINSLPVVTMIVGSMGKRKTTLLTDIAISQSAIFRNKAQELLRENDLKFPNFPWINLEKEIQSLMKSHTIYNLATCEKYIKSCRRNFEAFPCRKNCLDYDYTRHGLYCDDKLKIVYLWDVLLNYAKLYFIYFIQSSYILGNYAIRTDSIIADEGNFPYWDHNFLERNSLFIDEQSRFSHVLDFDMLRLGKTVIKNNRNKDAFEFGVVTITEAGKERGNQFDTNTMKKTDPMANQLNDKFNSRLKMARHSATVDNYPFIKIFMDEQRPESIGADVRELCDVINIDAVSDRKLAMPFFFLGELLYDFIFSRFINIYNEYRFNRGDNCLLMFIYKSIVGKIHNYYNRIYNRYSFFCLNIGIEDGKLKGGKEQRDYFLLSKKIYSKRFSTDCYGEFFVKKSERSTVGLTDLPEFNSIKASFDEMSSANSFFYNDMLENFDIEFHKRE